MSKIEYRVVPTNEGYSVYGKRPNDTEPRLIGAFQTQGEAMNHIRWISDDSSD